MGKRKAQEKQRRKHDKRSRDQRQADDRRLVELLTAAGDPLAVMHALTASPLGMHRHLVLCYAVEVVLRRQDATKSRATTVTKPIDFMEIFELLERRTRHLGAMEDAVPLDPRLPAAVRFNDHVYRLYPGMLERPVAALRRAELVASAVDGSLIGILKFGLSDFVALCLTHSELAIAEMTDSWPTDEQPALGALPQVTVHEIVAAGTTTRWLGLDSNHLHPTRSREAMRWATADPSELRAQRRQSLGDTCFGTTVAVEAAGGNLALPLPYIAECWEKSISVLARTAVLAEPRLEARWRSIARAEVMRHIHRINGFEYVSVLRAPAGPVLLMSCGERHVLAIAVAATLHSSCDTRKAWQAVNSVRPGARLSLRDHVLTVPRDAEIVRLVVAAVAGAASVLIPPETALLTLDDLYRVADTCSRPDEFYAFCRDMQNPPGGVVLEGWDRVDFWESWRSHQQSFHQAGLAPDGIYFIPHQAAGEWAEAAANAGLERALHRVGLPVRQDLVGVDVSGDRAATLTRDHQLWHLTLSGNGTVAVTCEEPIPLALRELAVDIPGTMCWVLSQITPTLDDLLAETGTEKVIFKFRFDQESADPIALGAVDMPSFTAEVRMRHDIADFELTQPGFIQHSLGELFCETLRQLAGLDTIGVSDLQQHWQAVSPMFGLAVGPVTQTARVLEKPLLPGEWARSQARREFAEHLHQAGVTSGLMRGDAAMNFETETVAPWLIARLHLKLAAFSTSSVVIRAAVELEGGTSVRTRARQERRRNLHVWRTPNLDQELEDQDTELAGHRAILAAVLEIALATESPGTQTPDEIEWQELLGLGSLYVQATLRSDSMRWNLGGEATQITESYEVDRVPADPPMLDLAAYSTARRSHGRFPQMASPASDLSDEDADNGVLPTRTLADIDPSMSGVDEAMLADVGFSAHTLLATCKVISQAEASHDHPVIEIERDDLVELVTAQANVGRDEANAVLQALSLTRDGLRSKGIQPWKARARDHRLMTKPVVVLPSGRILLLPWNTALTGEVFSDYIFNGLLPWPSDTLDGMPHIKRVLDQLRLKRTRVLEDETHLALVALGLRVKSRTLPQDARLLGLSSIPGEIDHVAIHPDGDTIWVIDDKESVEPNTPAEIARSVNNFHNPRGEIDKLCAKASVIRANVEAVENALKVDHRSRRVEALFVTRAPIAAAFRPSTKARFALLGQLSTVVTPS